MKYSVLKILAVLAYWFGVDALFYWLNRKAKRIITFHNILPDELFRNGIANGVSNKLGDFERIIDECGKCFMFSTDLFDAKTLTITFDDGYRNQYTTAFKALQKRGIPAYLFVSGENLQTHNSRSEYGLLIDKLLHWVAEAPIELIPDGNRLRYWVVEIWPRFMADSENKGKKLFSELCAKYPYEKIVESLPDDYVHERLDIISDVELDEMRHAGWKIGWHTGSHYPLARLPGEALRRELDSPEEFRQVCLSYPYGNPVEVGDAAIKMAETMGYPCAVSNTNTAMSNTSRFFLPRMSLPVNKYRLHFRLSGLEYFIKHRKLLPVVR